MKNYDKYKRLYDWKKPFNRTWTDKQIENAPIWCSVDLRDGNQALANPMNLHEKVRFFKYLISIGFKEIEIGFPAASETEYNFTRYLIENDMIPDDVTIQVITQAREDIVSKTFAALHGVKKAIVHVYNSVSKIQRDVVFNKSKEEVKEIAVKGAQLLLDYSSKYPSTEWQFEYSPESFTNAEIDYSIEVVNAVLDVWKDVNVKPIINFPSSFFRLIAFRILFKKFFNSSLDFINSFKIGLISSYFSFKPFFSSISSSSSSDFSSYSSFSSESSS